MKRALLVFCLLSYASLENFADNSIHMKQIAIQYSSKELHLAKDDLSAELVQNKFFHNWQFWRIFDDSLPPLMLFVAADNEEAHKITLDSGLKDLIRKEPVKLSSSKDALEYITFFLSMADPLVKVISNVNEIPGVSEQDKDIWKKKINSPIIKKSNKSVQFTVMFWLLKQGKLLFSTTNILIDGVIEMEAEVAAENIGVTISIE